jgi:hypothetical protein
MILTTMVKKWLQRLAILHPFLFVAVRPLDLYAGNVRWMHLGIFVKPLVALAILTANLWLVAWLIVRDRERSAFMASVVILALTLYGQLYGEMHFLPRGVFSLVWIVSAVALLIFAYRSPSFSPRVTMGAALFGCFLVLFRGVPVVEWLQVRPIKYTVPDLARNIQSNSTLSRPNILYLVLDGAARQDVLKEYYGYDNSAFLDSLTHLGFHIARESRTNYGQTMLSLASSLNGAYVDDMVPPDLRARSDRRPLHGLIANSAVFNALHRQGYRIVVIHSGYTGTEIRNADSFVAPVFALNEMDEGIIASTLVDRGLELLFPDWRVDIHRSRVEFVFDELPEQMSQPGPVIVFAHVVSPHPPFVFGKEGERVTHQLPPGYGDGTDFVKLTSREEYVTRYRNQMQFIEKQTLAAVSQILATASSPPVIIIQGDHGPGSRLDWDHPEQTDMWERLAILNAIYLPGPDTPSFRSSETPVNTFRIVLNRYFRANLPMLPDTSYFSSWREPYDYVYRAGLTHSGTAPQLSD